MLDDYDIREQDTLDNIAEYANGENLTQRCPDCEAEITDGNELISDIYNPEAHGSCLDCYDPTPYYPDLG